MVNKPRSDERSPSPDRDEEFDLAAFQASLDSSVNAAKLLVDGWIPQEFGQGSGIASSVQSLKERARPPRMGLGAQPAAIHKQQAEDRKLKERLLGKGRNGTFGDEGSTVKAVDASKSGDDASGSDSDDEDSRSRVISKGKGKAKATAVDPLSTGSNGVKHAANNPFVTTTKKTKIAAASPSATPRKASTNAPPLFNDPSPSKPTSAAPESTSAAPTSSSSTRTIAPVSFYSKSTDKSEPAGTLSKNQRKKLRKQEREQENKNRLIGESRAEEEAERKKASKRPRDENGDDEDVEMGPPDAEAVEPVSNPSTGDATGADPKKKKKKRKGKGKGGDSTLAQPLLNL
ncbi:hypothetical protein JCM11491_000125 [Sporobolomyces phaffii]